MKNNQLMAMLVGLLFLSALASGWLIYTYNSSIHKLQRLDAELFQVNKASSLFQSMWNDTVEYSKTAKNPDITHILQSLNAPKAPTEAAKPVNK